MLLFNGLVLAALYAILALSFTLVYGVMRLINFAYAGLFVVAAYLAIWGLEVARFGSSHYSNGFAKILGLTAALVLVMVIIGALGAVVDQVTYRPLRAAPILSPLITSLAVVYILQNLTLLVAGSTPLVFPIELPSRGLIVAGVNIAPGHILVIVAAIILLVALRSFVHGTSLGLRIRAIADDVLTAQLIGIRTERTIAWVFAIGSALGAAAAVLYALYFGTVTYNVGYMPTLTAFAAAVLGGIGSLEGAAIGALVLGLVESFVAGYGPGLTHGVIGSNYESAVAFIILIAVLVFRPTGILGDKVAIR